MQMPRSNGSFPARQDQEAAAKEFRPYGSFRRKDGGAAAPAASTGSTCASPTTVSGAGRAIASPVTTRGVSQTPPPAAAASTVSDRDAEAAFTRQAQQRLSFRQRMQPSECELDEERELMGLEAMRRDDPTGAYRTQSPAVAGVDGRRVGKQSPLTVATGAPGSSYSAGARGMSPRTLNGERSSPYTVNTMSPPRRRSGQFAYPSLEERDGMGEHERPPSYEASAYGRPSSAPIQSPIHLQHHGEPPGYSSTPMGEYGPSPTYNLYESGVPAHESRASPPHTESYNLALRRVDNQLVPGVMSVTSGTTTSGGDGDEDPEVAALHEQAMGKKYRRRPRPSSTQSQDSADLDSGIEEARKSCTPQAFMFYMEQHIENIIKSHKERQERRLQLEREMDKIDLDEETREKMVRILHQKESNYLRVKRSKMDR